MPLLKYSEIQILLGPGPPVRAPGKVPASGMNFNSTGPKSSNANFMQMEVHILNKMQGTSFRPHVTYFTSSDNPSGTLCVIGELIQLRLTVSNVLKIPLVLKEIYLLWKFRGQVNEQEFIVSNELADLKSLERFVKTHVLESVTIPVTGEEVVTMVLTPLAVGEVILEGMAYTLVSPVGTENQVTVAGKQVFPLDKKYYKMKVKANDNDLKLTCYAINIAPTAPSLQVVF